MIVIRVCVCVPTYYCIIRAWYEAVQRWVDTAAALREVTEKPCPCELGRYCFFNTIIPLGNPNIYDILS